MLCRESPQSSTARLGRWAPTTSSAGARSRSSTNAADFGVARAASRSIAGRAGEPSGSAPDGTRPASTHATYSPPPTERGGGRARAGRRRVLDDHAAGGLAVPATRRVPGELEDAGDGRVVDRRVGERPRRARRPHRLVELHHDPRIFAAAYSLM